MLQPINKSKINFAGFDLVEEILLVMRRFDFSLIGIVWLVKQMQDSQDWKLFNRILTPISDEKEVPLRIGKDKLCVGESQR